MNPPNYYTLPHLGPTNTDYLYGLPLEQKLNFKDFIFSSLKKTTKGKEIKNEKNLLVEKKKGLEKEIKNNIKNKLSSSSPPTQLITTTTVRRGRPSKKNNEVSSGTTVVIVEEEKKIT
jgi:hypothetical protein